MFWFPRRELLGVIDEFNDDLQYLASTKGSSSALVGGWSCTCAVHCTFQSLLFSSIFFPFHFIVNSMETVTETFGASYFFFLSLSFVTPHPSPVFFLLLFIGKL